MSTAVRCESCGRSVWLTHIQHDFVCQNCRAVALIAPVGDWVDDALCAEVGGDAWFPPMRGGATLELRMAQEICRQCPVRQECLDFAVANNEQYGVWGGLTPLERRPLVRALKAQLSTTTEEPTEGSAA